MDWQDGNLHNYNVASEKHDEIFNSPVVPITVHAWDSSLQPATDNPCWDRVGREEDLLVRCQVGSD